MRELDNLNLRLAYRGGNREGRMIQRKRETLQKSLFASYQAETAILADGREFKCLINPDKTKNDYDQKMISIPFEDICLNAERKGKTTQGIEPIGMKGGDVFTWKETDTKWLVYLQYLEENAYFRAEIRRCKTSVIINDIEYPVYVRGPVETTIQWLQKKGINWNKLNYSLELYITKNEDTLDFFHRFKKIKVDGKQYEVLTIDWYGGDGIIQVYLGETFTNTIEDEYYEPLEPSDHEEEVLPYIKGDDVIYPFDVIEYSIENIENPIGVWSLSNRKARILEQNEKKVKIEVTAGRSCNFTLSYKQDDEEITLPIIVDSLM